MNLGLVQKRQSEALARFFVMLFALTGAMAGFATFFSAGAVSPALHMRNAALRLLWLATAVKGRRAFAPSSFPEYFEPPDILPKQPDEYLTAQNIAGRKAALYRAWDELETQAGRLVRWRSARDGELSLFPDIGQLIATPLTLALIDHAERFGFSGSSGLLVHDMLPQLVGAPLIHDTS